MSTNLKTANVDDSILTYKIVVDESLNEVAIVDVTQGSGVLYEIEVDATAATSHQYLKLKFQTTEVVVGTTTPDLVLMCAAQKRTYLCLPGGVAYTGLSAWLVTSQADSANTNTESSNNRITTVRFVAS
jgi:hypothetical protein